MGNGFAIRHLAHVLNRLFGLSFPQVQIDEKDMNMESKYKIKINKDLSLGRLTDVLASVLISNVFEKQKFLEELNINQRAMQIAMFLEDRLRVLEITSTRRDEILEKRNLN